MFLFAKSGHPGWRQKGERTVDWEAFHNGLVSGLGREPQVLSCRRRGGSPTHPPTTLTPHPRTPSTPTCVWPDSPRSGGWRWSIGPGIRSSILGEERESKSWGAKSWGALVEDQFGPGPEPRAVGSVKGGGPASLGDPLPTGEENAMSTIALLLLTGRDVTPTRVQAARGGP